MTLVLYCSDYHQPGTNVGKLSTALKKKLSRFKFDESERTRVALQSAWEFQAKRERQLYIHYTYPTHSCSVSIVCSSCFFPHYIVCMHLLYKPISFISVRQRHRSTFMNNNDHNRYNINEFVEQIGDEVMSITKIIVFSISFKEYFNPKSIRYVVTNYFTHTRSDKIMLQVKKETKRQLQANHEKIQKTVWFGRWKTEQIETNLHYAGDTI